MTLDLAVIVLLEVLVARARHTLLARRDAQGHPSKTHRPALAPLPPFGAGSAVRRRDTKEAVYHSREVQAGICAGCYSRLMQEGNAKEGVR